MQVGRKDLHWYVSSYTWGVYAAYTLIFVHLIFVTMRGIFAHIYV